MTTDSKAQRQLAAIMFTDIVGYTALMGKDSAKALELIRISKDIQKPLVEKHNGKWLKEMGDGAMAQFNTALDAVNCSIDIQESARAKLDAKLRIGIHLGDITIENDDVYGDGVNVASRLESIADAGGIYISDAIEKAIQGQSDVQAKYLGEIKLKNVAYGVRTYALQGIGLPVPKLKQLSTSLLEKVQRKGVVQAVLVGIILVIGIMYFYPKYFSNDSRPDTAIRTTDNSIAVLYFDNMSGDPDQEYFSDGMTEEIIAQLTKIAGIRVISRSSTRVYKGQPLNVKKMGEELGVSFILEGSVRKAQNQLKITVQLINTITDEHVWAHTYDKELTAENIFEIQDDIAEAVIKALKVALGTDASMQIRRRAATDLETYTLYLKGEFYGGKGNFDKSIMFYQRAIERDPDYATAYAALANEYMWQNLSYDPSPKWEEEAYVAVGQALSLDPQMAEAHLILGMLNWSPGNNWRVEESLNEFERAITLKPNLSNAYMYLSLVQFHIGLSDEAIKSGLKCIELDPLNHSARRFIGWALLYQGKYSESLKICENLPESSADVFNISITALNLHYLNRVDEALELAENYLLKDSESSIMNSTYAIFLASQGRKDEANERMQLAIDNAKDYVHTHHTYHNLAGASALMGNSEEAIEWLNKAGEDGLTCYPFYNLDPNLISLKSDPAFETFMLKMKKKWEYHKSLYASSDQ